MAVTWKYYNKRLTKNNLESALYESEQRLDMIRDEIKFYCFSNPMPILNAEGLSIDPAEHMPMNVRELLDQLEEEAANVFVLRGIKEDMDFACGTEDFVEWED